ncbi:hypothetical protein KR100_11835 [Synechococcus sp. KORDI-100]|nr:hypothetical protein KR100_11835 [Synechococcus sp. KORDI-100]
MQQHLLKGDGEGRGMTESHHGQGVPHQNGIGASRLNPGRRKAVPGRQHGDGSTGLLEPDQIGGAHRPSGGPEGTLLASDRLGPMRLGRPNLVRTGREQPHGMLRAGVDSESPL